MKLLLKWSNLNDAQRAQIKDFYGDDLKDREIYEHSLNSRQYGINPLTGDVIFTKDM